MFAIVEKGKIQACILKKDLRIYSHPLSLNNILNLRYKQQLNGNNILYP